MRHVLFPGPRGALPRLYGPGASAQLQPARTGNQQVRGIARALTAEMASQLRLDCDLRGCW